MVTTVLVGIGAALLVLCLGLSGVALFVSRSSLVKPSKKKAASGVQESYLEVLASRIAAVEVSVGALPSLWEEERERAVKQANRATQAVRDLEELRARGTDEPDPDADVQPGNVDGLEPQFVLPVLDGLDEPPDDLQTRANQALAIFGRR